MKKFKHFTEEEISGQYRGKSFNLIDTEDEKIDGLTIYLSPKFYKESVLYTINRALDDRLVQRVIDEKVQEENKVKIGDNEYTLEKLPDGNVWMMENLREEVEGAVWNEKYDCYMYAFEQAQEVVPEGFHLPSPREFMDLALALGYLKDPEYVVMERFINEYNFALSGLALSTGTLYYQGSYGWYWSSMQSSATYGYSLYFDSSSVNPSCSVTKSNCLAVRCIKD